MINLHQPNANAQGECRLTFPRGHKPMRLVHTRTGMEVQTPPMELWVWVPPERCPVCLLLGRFVTRGIMP